MNADALVYCPDPAELPALLADWQAAHPELGVLLLVPEAEQAHVPNWQAVCRAAGIPVTGAIFPALIGDGRFRTHGVVALRFDRCPHWFLIDALSDADKASAALAAAVGPVEGRPTLMLIFDGLLPFIGSTLYKLFDRLHTRVHYAGVNAGSESFQPMPCLFDAHRLVGNGVLGLLVPQRPIVRHGYPVSKSLMKATATTGNRINRIDGRPAFEVYQEVIRAEYGVALTRDNFYDYAVHYPFGEIAALNVLVRIPVGFDDDGSLHCVGEIPPNSLLRLIQAPAVDDARCLAEIACTLPPGRSEDVLLTFYCAGRRMHFGPAAELELSQLRLVAKVGQLVGALSLGEIDTDQDLGLPQFHNAALVCLR